MRRLATILLATTVVMTMSPAAEAEVSYRYDNRLLRISHLTINDGTTGGANGDGDGFAECGETIVIEVQMAISNYSPRLRLTNPTVTVDPRANHAALIGNNSSTLPSDFHYGQTATVPDRFTIQIGPTVDPWETIYFVVDVAADNQSQVFRRHRHIPVSCGITGGDPTTPPRITMPMYGIPSYTSTWLADRYELLHEGVDIFEDQMTPVLAAADGVISTLLWTNDLAHESPIVCCSMSIKHDDGWESWYIHLNNDTIGTDNDLGDRNPTQWEIGFVPALHVGDRVTAGQLIGWVGNSGNAKGTPHHLHFELHDPAGNPINPFISLLTADRPVNPYGCPAVNDICRVAGSNRYATAAAASRKANPGGADTVYVATGGNFPDAIAAGPAAAHEDAPILLTASNALPRETYDELRRLGPSTIVVVGGEVAIWSSVVDELRDAAPTATIVRRFGATRYETATALSRAAFGAGRGGTVYVVTGQDFPDALLTSAMAIRDDAPLLLTRRTSLPTAVRDELTRLAPDRIVLVGGTAAVNASVRNELEAYGPVERIAASDRYSMSTWIAATEFADTATVYVALGTRFPDALSAITLIAAQSGPVLMVDDDRLPAVVATELVRRGASQIVVLGGEAAVTLPVFARLTIYAG
jgi:putative cell wall-binding protein